MTTIPLTKRGAEKLKEELARLKNVERHAVIQAIAEARAQGDLSENAEYEAAKDKQGFIEGRILEIEGKLSAFTKIEACMVSGVAFPQPFALAMLPLTWCGGLTQDMFEGIVWPLLVSLGASLLVSLTLTPVLVSPDGTETRMAGDKAGTAEVEKMNEAGVSAVVGAFASAICLATTQAAAKYNLPHVVDVGVADQIVQRGLKNTFRFGPGYGVCARVAVINLHVLNTAAGKPAKTVMIIHEESLFGTGTANLLARELPGYGFEVKEIVKHANPTRDFNNIVLRMKSVNPDIVIPANYYNEYALLVRTMQQQKVMPKALYSVLGGAASRSAMRSFA